MTKAVEGCVARSFSRVHFGLIQTSESYRNMNGGAGVALDNPHWEFILKPTSSKIPRIHVNESCGKLSSDLEEFAKRALSDFADIKTFELSVVSSVPHHVGLGAGTSFRVGVVNAIRQALGQGLQQNDWCRIGRGGTSGVGVNVCLDKGFVVDLGRRRTSAANFMPSSSVNNVSKPAVLTKLEFPVEWKILLVRSIGEMGFSGAREIDVFRENLPLSKEEVQETSAVMLWDILPSVISGDINGFCKGIVKFQGIGFKRIEWTIQSELTLQLRKFLNGFSGIGYALSSMGPSIAVIGTDLLPVEQALKNRFGDRICISWGR
ncbi:hypothetical protein IT893_07390 [Thalassospira sp. A40-3]|uniref:beta-ribofuranosylaminobenzene 5'-phosphate synthase family protein n=1 Tax=Thalassospira sp. A40-3 TaxID=2785908 RepID=UPI0018CEDEBF|nr:beta-ribofuranosylaminobenzene 5'-phosphate synthase family protein [Thalassospira sp. A40-3]QPO13321.1 hypothetical protein IT893_07390 [Thalassospira sp. A40-3]